MDFDLNDPFDLPDLSRNPWFWLGYAQEVADDLHDLIAEILALAERSGEQLARPDLRDRYIALTADVGQAAARLRTETSQLDPLHQELALALATSTPTPAPADPRGSARRDSPVLGQRDSGRMWRRTCCRNPRLTA